MNTQLDIGRYCDLHGITEETSLVSGLDFRLPQYRREVFLRFYEFHLKYKAHPGAVYYIFPYLQKKFDLSKDQMLWLAYINGCSQNIITSWLIFNHIPSVDSDLNKFEKWFRQNYDKLGWDTDRRYIKNSFIKCIENYRYILAGRTNEQFFEEQLTGNKFKNFEDLWNTVMDHFHLFGRLATFSYIEYLRIVGLNVQCNNLFINDINGSKSHRNGLCKVLGRDDLDWNKDNDVKYSDETLHWLNVESNKLLIESANRIKHPDLGLFTLESTLCCYKSWHRKNRRYPNVYNDMFHDRIKYAEKKWNREFSLFWEARKENLPIYLRLEDNPNDPGLKPIKQNHYRNTGEVIMMDKEWECFTNSFNKEYSNLEMFI